jgi:ubiquinone/menaquinone biosynthesis C-methylase UbiE
MADGPGATRGWLLDEMISIGRENMDQRHVARYDEKEDADAAAEVRLLQSAGLNPGSTVVDLGAGTGQFALAAGEAFERVVAVDPSPVMLSRLRAKARSRSTPLEIVQGGFLTYGHIGDPPDVVYSRYALHHLPDFWKAIALGRIRRLLRPQGIFRLWDVVYHFPADEAEDRIEQWCASVPSGGDGGGWTRADLEEHVRDEHSTFTWLLEPMIRQAGFELRHVSYSDDGFFAKYLLAVS